MEKVTKILQTIKFATKTHEVYQKQKRKGKDIAYLTHPLTVGLILSQMGADEDIVCAGILHDTIEDSIEEKKVSFDMLKDRFGERVAGLVSDVTEPDRSLGWQERKAQAREHIKAVSKDSILLKSADIISNLSELIDDYRKDGDAVFARFNAPKEAIILNTLQTIHVIISSWPEGPLVSVLQSLVGEAEKIR
jgi:(p)ppGpp synthase/HD superfamily hydrolase